MPLAAWADDDEDVLLYDEFDDGDIATNTAEDGVGSGFHLNLCAGGGGCPGSPFGNTVTEANGVATVAGPATIKAIVSNDPIDPRGTTLIWVIRAPRPDPSTTPNGEGVNVGWAESTSEGCCGNGVFLEIGEGRVVFDVIAGGTASRYFRIDLGSTAKNAVYTNNNSTVVAKIKLSATEWRVQINGQGVHIKKSGTFGGVDNTPAFDGFPDGNCDNFAGGAGPCATLNGVLNLTGNVLHALAAGFRENASASFDRVTVTADDDDDEDD